MVTVICCEKCGTKVACRVDHLYLFCVECSSNYCLQLNLTEEFTAFCKNCI